jgi:hypothetical protein
MPSLRHVLCTVTMAAVTLAASANLAAAQKILQYGRFACPGSVTIKTLDQPNMPVQQLQIIFARVPSTSIEWSCDNRPQRAYNCPAGTNIIQVDRRQVGDIFSMTCLRR